MSARSLSPAALAIVREAIAAAPTADSDRLAGLVRRASNGMSVRELRRLLGMVAFLAAHFASRLEDGDADLVLAMLEAFG